MHDVNQLLIMQAQDYPKSYFETLSGERFYYSDLIKKAEKFAKAIWPHQAYSARFGDSA